MRIPLLSALALGTVLLTNVSEAHPGRRFQIRLADQQLVAQGVNTGGSDGAPDTRPYPNVIHDHWHNSPVIGVESASSILPEFDILSPASELQFRPIELTLLSVSKWINPPVMPPPGTTPVFEDLSSGEVLSLSLNSQTVDSNDLGSLFLTSSVPPEGLTEIQLNYVVNRKPENEIYVLEMVLSSSNPAVQSSDLTYILLSPDGSSAEEKLHHASLFLEHYLGIHAVPEPGTLAVAFIGAVVLGSGVRYRRSS